MREGPKVLPYPAELPGIMLASAVAALAVAIHMAVPVISVMPLAMVVGIIVGNATLRSDKGFARGLGVTRTVVLRMGIALLGARVALVDILDLGVGALATGFVTMVVAAMCTLVAARLLRVDLELAVLTAVGLAVCGVSAIVALGPVIGAQARNTGYAIAVITVLGTMAVVTYPVIGASLALDDRVYGVWVGAAVHDTSQVIAAGAANSDRSLELAAVVKLLRNLLLGPVLMLTAWIWWNRQIGLPESRPAFIPSFVVAFFVLAAVRSIGYLDVRFMDALGDISAVLLAIALAAVGLSIRIQDLRATGMRPLMGAAASAAVASITALTLSRLWIH